MGPARFVDCLKKHAVEASICLILAAYVAASGIAVAQTAAQGNLQTGVVFDQYSDVSSNGELIRRTMTPLAVAETQKVLTRLGKRLQPQSIDLATETFAVYVPATPAPAHGFALLVFIPPWQGATLPQDWGPVLDAHGTILVTAARSGNNESVLARREPLALLAEQNIAHHYKVDPDHIYIGGFSGGARVAMRLALAYPDIFRGAFLDAGSDPIGSLAIPLPPADLFSRFQDSTHLVYVTGENDIGSLGLAASSARSMRDWCAYNIDTDVVPRTTHEIAGAAAFSWAMDMLLGPVQTDSAREASCRTDVQSTLDAKLTQIKTLMDAGKSDEAKAALIEVNNRYGGLAEQPVLDLATALKLDFSQK